MSTATETPADRLDRVVAEAVNAFPPLTDEAKANIAHLLGSKGGASA